MIDRWILRLWERTQKARHQEGLETDVIIICICFLVILGWVYGDYWRSVIEVTVMYWAYVGLRHLYYLDIDSRTKEIENDKVAAISDRITANTYGNAANKSEGNESITDKN